MSYQCIKDDEAYDRKVKYRDKVGFVKGRAIGADGRECYVVDVPDGPWHTHLFPVDDAEEVKEDSVSSVWSDFYDLASPDGAFISHSVVAQLLKRLTDLYNQQKTANA